MKKIIIPSLYLLLLAGCKKGDNTAPTISITSPADNQSFPAGTTVHVKATITDNVEIHHVHLYVTNANTDAQLLHFEDHVDLGTYNLDQTFVTQAGISYKIDIQADDHSGNTGEAVVRVTSN